MFLRVPYDLLKERRSQRSGYATAGRLLHDGTTSLSHYPSRSSFSNLIHRCASNIVSREQMNTEGAFWKDPPGYFEQLVHPAYLDAHRSMFTVRDLHRSRSALSRNGQDGDVEGGSPLLPGLVLIEPLRMSMDDIVARCCGELVSVLRRPDATEPGDAQP
jgi:nicotinamide/nicotinate riboside kinase